MIDDQTRDVFFNLVMFDKVTGFGRDGAYVPGNFSHPAPGFVCSYSENNPSETKLRVISDC